MKANAETYPNLHSDLNEPVYELVVWVDDRGSLEDECMLPLLVQLKLYRDCQRRETLINGDSLVCRIEEFGRAAVLWVAPARAHGLRVSVGFVSHAVWTAFQWCCVKWV